jgi:hypothetical protein
MDVLAAPPLLSFAGLTGESTAGPGTGGAVDSPDEPANDVDYATATRQAQEEWCAT